MSKQNDIYTDLWSPQALKIRPCSHLFSLKPIGIGTSVTESLSSYLCRLADEHCVSLQKLVTQEISSLIIDRQREQDSTSRSISSIFGNSDAKPAINGMREMTRSLINTLEQLTLRQDLRYLSCLTYQGVIKDRSFFRQHKAWCHQCFEQQKQERQIVYEPLLWSFKDVNYCLQHKCQLQDRCLHCDSTQKAIANNSRLGFCDRCKQWLGSERNDEIEIVEKERQIPTGIGELIATAPALDSPPTLPDTIQKLKLIQLSFERSFRQDLTQFIALGKVLEQLKIAIAHHPDKPLNLVGLLIPVCSLADISVAQFFKEDISGMSKILSVNFNSQIQKISSSSSLASMFNFRV
ncbi:MAG: TniQ family protein [Pleurocapsa sp. MO_192.B19]|nr:TniQ family protein [Pleurocapsa sp. MO_192.B19]